MLGWYLALVGFSVEVTREISAAMNVFCGRNEGFDRGGFVGMC